MEICPKEQCTGCYACVNICNSQCITMQEDEYGELHPVIDESICKHCGLCERICPNNINLSFNYPIKCYASWISNKEKRRECASGGIATIISEYVIQYKKGVVFGTRYNKDLIPIVTWCDDLESLQYFKGSKYVQSIVGETTLKKAKCFLQSGRFVLFIGTPCQIAGLRSFLKKDYENLITIDLICHGVSPTKYFNDEINFLKSKKKITTITNVRFRGNDSNNYCFTLWDKNKLLYKEKGNTSYYLGGFLLGLTLRENCYSCNYACPERISDITIGDFIGLGSKIEFKYSKRNVSSVTLNTKKAYAFYENLIGLIPELTNVEREYRERLDYAPSLLYPFPRPSLNFIFREKYLLYGYVESIRLVLKNIVYINKLKNYVRCLTYVYRIPRKIYRITKEYFKQ